MMIATFFPAAVAYIVVACEVALVNACIKFFITHIHGKGACDQVPHPP